MNVKSKRGAIKRYNAIMQQTDAEALAVYAMSIMELRIALRDLLNEAQSMNEDLRKIGRGRPDDSYNAPIENARIALLRN